MTILNTTFVVADGLMERFLAWARETYIPAMNETGIFSKPVMAKVLAQVEPGATSVAVQAVAESLEMATHWHDNDAALLIERMSVGFNRQVLFFSTYMEVLE